LIAVPSAYEALFKVIYPQEIPFEYALRVPKGPSVENASNTLSVGLEIAGDVVSVSDKQGFVTVSVKDF